MNLNKTIWKFKLTNIINVIEVPTNSKILCVQLQDDVPCVWVELFSEANMPIEKRFIEIIGTGHILPKNLITYIGTFQKPPFVFHVYETTP